MKIFTHLHISYQNIYFLLPVSRAVPAMSPVVAPADAAAGSGPGLDLVPVQQQQAGGGQVIT